MYVKNKLSFFALLFLFFGPLLAAWYLYSTGGSFSKKTVNNGTLIQPALALAQVTTGQQFQDKAKGKWLVVYITAQPCETECQQVLYKMRQVRLTLGKDQQRVQRVLLTSPKLSPEQLPKEFAGTWLWQMDVDKNKLLPQDHIYLVDPLGNIFMQYPQDVTPRALKDDLVRLLKVSRIG
jgi:hypothetical protein